MYRIGWFSTGRDEAARDLLKIVMEAIRGGEILAKIDFVFCNRERGDTPESNSFLSFAEDIEHYQGIPLVTFSFQKFRAESKEKDPKKLRQKYDREIMYLLKRFSVNLSVLAGYMLIVGEEMCTKYPMINLHPAAPGGPKGTWQKVIWKLIESKAKETGVMMHLVTWKLDEGPPVAYCTFSIRGEPFNQYWAEIEGRSVEEIKEAEGEKNPLFKRIREYGLAREFPLIVSTLRAFAEGKVRIKKRQVLDDKGKILKQGYNLTSEIEEKLKP